MRRRCRFSRGISRHHRNPADRAELATTGSIQDVGHVFEENAMKSTFNSTVIGWSLTGLLLIAAGAQAASGFTVTTEQENTIAVGMSMPEVRQLLGRADHTARYGNAPGPIWTYRVVAPLFGKTEFNVEFGGNDRVIAKGEYVIGNESPNNGRD